MTFSNYKLKKSKADAGCSANILLNKETFSFVKASILNNDDLFVSSDVWFEDKEKDFRIPVIFFILLPYLKAKRKEFITPIDSQIQGNLSRNM